MIHDNLIETIYQRAESYFENYDYINAHKCYERLLRRVFRTIEDEKIDTIPEYLKKYDFDFDLLYAIDVYLTISQDCFMETGDKNYLEKIIEFKENYIYLFQSEEYLYLTILRGEIEAIFYLGRKEEAFSMYEKLIKKYPEIEENYMNMSRLYSEIGKLEKAIEILKIGIEKCEFGKEDMRQMLDIYKDDMKNENKKKKK